MLKDVPIKKLTARQRKVAEELKFDADAVLPSRVREGVYVGGLNCTSYFYEGRLHHMNDMRSRKAWREVYDRFERREIEWADYRRLMTPLESWYGVADTPEQVEAHYAALLTDPSRAYTIVYTPIRREHEPERDGWRWCKWGPYIGTQRREADYLHDEPHIEEIVVYHVYAHQKNAPLEADHPGLKIIDPDE